MGHKPVTIKEEKDLMHELAVNAHSCLMIDNRQRLVLKSIRKKLNFLYKNQSLLHSVLPFEKYEYLYGKKKLKKE